MKNLSLGALQNPCQTWKGFDKAISSKMERNRAFRKAKSSNSQGVPKFARCAKFWQGVPNFRRVQTPSKDDFSEDEWLSFTFLRVMEASNLELCMPYWIRDIEGRLVKIETPQETELEVCLNIMDCPPEDQHSQHGQEENLNAYRSMRDHMHPPRMSAPSCIDQWLEKENLNFSLRRMRNSMSVGRGTWKLSTLFQEDGMNRIPKMWEDEVSPNAKGGMYVLSEDMDMKAKFATMARRLEELELKKV
ncbi:hypothetical protein AAG906_013034 [Vitis piasezkii]